MKFTKKNYQRFSKEGLISKLSSGRNAFCLGFLFCSFISGYIILYNNNSVSPTNDRPQLHANKLYKQVLALTQKLFTNDVKNNGSLNYEQNTVIAGLLSKEVKILCWIMTNPANHATKAKAVKETWGKRCNKLLFMSTELDADLDTVALNVAEDRDHLWAKTKEAFRYVYRYYLDDYDWFYKADDDTYAVVENMRFMLHAYSSDTPIYFGCKFRPFVTQGYMSGGAGYVLSREALRRFAEKGIHDNHTCAPDDVGAEDLEMGRCMEKLNVTAGDSRDDLERGKFFFGDVEYAMFPSEPGSDWTWEYAYYGLRSGFNCCSNNAIAFHYMTPHQMYTYEYLIYHLQPYGVINLPQQLQEKVSYERVAEINKRTTTTTTEHYNNTESTENMNSSSMDKSSLTNTTIVNSEFTSDATTNLDNISTSSH